MMIFVVSMAGVCVLQLTLSRQPVLLGMALRFAFLRIDSVCLLGHLVPGRLCRRFVFGSVVVSVIVFVYGTYSLILVNGPLGMCAESDDLAHGAGDHLFFVRVYDADRNPAGRSRNYAVIRRISFFFECFHHSFTFRSLKALPITETELRLIAAPAMMGLSSRPKNGYSAPAAKGMPRAL